MAMWSWKEVPGGTNQGRASRLGGSTGGREVHEVCMRKAQLGGKKELAEPNDLSKCIPMSAQRGEAPKG